MWQAVGQNRLWLRPPHERVAKYDMTCEDRAR